MVFSEAVGTPTVTIDGNGATESCTSTTQCTATYQMQAGDTEGTIAFTLDFADVATNSGVQVTAVTGGGTVTFDETAPTIGVQAVATDGYVNKDEKASFTITGISSGANGQTVTVAYGGVQETGTIANDGTWSVTMCDDENCASVNDGLITVTADTSDTAGNAATQTSILASQDTVDPTTTISSIDISADTGSSATDFITKTAAQTITATLSAALASGETLQISVNGGSSWANDDHATADGTSVSAAGYTLSGTSSIQMRIVDAAANDGSASSQAYTLDTTAPTLGTVGIATGGSGNSNNGDTITLTFTASEEIQTPTCSMSDADGNALDNSGSMAVNNPTGNTWTCAVTTGDNDANGGVTFSIAFTDVGGTAGNADSTVDDGSSVTIDNTHPTASAVTIAVSGSGNANNGDVVTLTIDPSEAIGTPTCTWTDGSGAMADTSVTYGTTGDDSHTAAVTVADADEDGAVGFSCTFSDTAGNAVASAVTALTAGSAITIDNTHPSITGVTAAWGTHLNAAEDNADKTITITTSGAEDGQTVTTTINSVTDTCTVNTNTCAVTYAASDMASLSSGTSYTIAVDVSDAATNAATQNTGTSFIYDPTLPTISSIAVTGVTSGQYGNSGTYTVVVTASETLAAAPTLTLSGGSVGSGSGSTSDTVWTYTFTPTDADESVTIDVGAGAITDSAGNVNTATPTQFAFTHDATAPTASAVTIAVSGTGNANNGDVVTLTIDPSEAIGAPTCTWTDGSGAMEDTSVTYDTVDGTDHHTAAVTVADADQDGTVGFSCTFSDLAGNAVASAVTSLTGGSAITIDNTHPTISAVTAAWGTHLNAVEDNSDGTVTVTTSGAADGQTVTTTINGVSDTCSVSSNSCTVTVAASDLQALTSGTTYTIAADVSDAAGNAATQNTGTSFVYDSVAPAISSIAVTGVTSGQYGNSAGTYTVIVTAAEALSAAPTLTLAGGSVGSGAGSSSDTVWTYTFTPTDADESVTIDLAIGAASDNAGNTNTAAATQFAFTHDATKPTLTITIASDGSGSSSISGDTISLTITASESVTGLVCTIGGESTTMGGSGTSWTSSRQLDGSEGVQIFSCGSHTDAAGNTGDADSTADTGSVTFDFTAPTLTIAMSSNGNSGYAKTGQKVILTITASEAVTGLACTIDGETATMGGSGTSWTAELTISGDETAGAATFSCAGYSDAAGNAGATDTDANSGSVIIDYTVPTVSSIAVTGVTSGQYGNSGTYSVIVTASEALSAAPTLTLSGGSVGSGTGSSSDTVWTYTFTPTDADESVTIDVDTGDITDPAGNSNTASPSQFAFTHDQTAPTLTIAMSSNGNSGYAKSGNTITLTITASESVTGLACTIDGETATMGGSGTSWTAALTISGDETAGAATFSCASHTDAAGNAGVTDTDANTGSVIIDYTVATPSEATAATTPTTDTSPDVVISVAEAGTIAVGGTTGCGLGSTSSMSSGSNTLTLSTNGDKAYVCTVTFTDAAGNTASALSLTSFTVDTTAPTTTIAYSGSSPATGSTFDVSITFSESVTGFTASEVVLSSGSATLSGSGTTYTATVTPASDSTITINVAAGVASDAAGNTNAVASQVSVESDQPDAPSIDSTAVTTATEDAAYSYTVSTSDADDGSPNSNTVTVTCSTCPSWLSYSSSTGKLTGTPANANVGSNSVVLTASNLDSNGNVIDSQTSTQSFTVTVTNVNSIGSVSLSGTTAEDQTLTATVSDPDGLTGVTITYQWQSTATPQTASTWSDISGASASTFQLTQSQVSKYVRVSVTYTDAQGGVESHTGMMGTAVSNVNDENTGTPTLSGTQAEDSTLTVSATPLTGNDEDGMTGSSYTYQWQRCTSNTASSCSDVSGSTSTTYLLGQADTNKFIRAAVSYVDDFSTTETVYTVFTSQIGNINDAPSAGADQTGAVTEDASTSTASNTVGASDPDTGDSLSYSASSATGTYGTFAVTSSGVWTYTLDNSDADTTALDASDQVTETFTITVSDDATPSLSDTMDVVITITGANDAPSAGADQTGSVVEDASTTTATGTVAGTDDDDSASLTYTPSTTSGTYGSIAFSGASWTYTLDNSDADTTALDANDQVTETFTVTVSDSTAQDTMDIVITITGANDAPSAGADQTGSVVEDASTATATGTVSGTDADDSASLS